MYVLDSKTRLIKVDPATTAYRNAGGSVYPVPAIYDGNENVAVFGFAGLSYQFANLTYNKPICFIDVVALNSARAGPCGLLFNGKSVIPDIRAHFPDGKKQKVRFSFPRNRGTIQFSTGSWGGSIAFFEVTAWDFA